MSDLRTFLPSNARHPPVNSSIMRSLFRSLAPALLAISTLTFASCSSNQPAPDPSYSAQRVTVKSRITIKNNSYKNVVLGLKGPETRFISIPARSSKSINLYSGVYKYAATAQGMNVVKGFKEFGTDRSYIWNFSIN